MIWWYHIRYRTGAPDILSCFLEDDHVPLEKMDAFFDARADIYDDHMLEDLGLEDSYAAMMAHADGELPTYYDCLFHEFALQYSCYY